MTTDTSTHRHTWDQIPWIVNGTLPESELRSAQSHLQSCADCREELEFQRGVAMSMEGAEISATDPQRSWQQLRARIDANSFVAGDRLEAFEAEPVRAAFSWTPWLAAAIVVQALGLGALGTALWSRPAVPSAASAAVYRTLSDATTADAADGATLRVVFAPDTSVGRMQVLLNEAGLQVRSGPSSAGVWSLEPARGSNRPPTRSALQQLRGNPEVRFAEAVGGAP